MCGLCIGCISAARVPEYSYRVAATSGAQGAGRGSRNTKGKIKLREYLDVTTDQLVDQPLSLFGLTNICNTTYASDFHAVLTERQSIHVAMIIHDWIGHDCHDWIRLIRGGGGTMTYSTCPVNGVRIAR